MTLHLSLRAKLAWWSAGVTAIALFTFGLLAALNLRSEQVEARAERIAGVGAPGHSKPSHLKTEDSDDDAFEELLTSYLLAAPGVVLVVAAGSWWLARKAMRPMADITRATAAITAESLGGRLPEPASRDEIAAHIRALNQMFDRLQRSFEQANRFTADAAHELRTPLTIMRGELEHGLRFGTCDGEQEKLIVSVLEEVGGLQRIVDTLLLLSRFDAGGALPERGSVDLSSLVGDAAQDTELLADAQRLAVRTDIAPGVTVQGDATLLRRLLLNLCDNAVRYNRPEGTVTLTLRREGPQALLSVANTGAAIPPERQGDLFKRFMGRNLDRPGGGSGTGLGLSLVKEIAVGHGGSAELVGSAHDRTEFAVRLPLT